MSALTKLQQHQHVLNELSTYSGTRRPGSGYTMILCPFHHERTPSFRVFHNDRSVRKPGYGICYGCGQRAAWDTFAPLIGLKPFQKPDPTKAITNERFRMPAAEVESLDVSESRKKAQAGDHRDFTLQELPRGKLWRGIKTSLLRRLGAFLGSYKNSPDRKFIYLPVNIKGEEVGYVRAQLRKDPDRPSYLNMEGTWAIDYGLFPFDYALEVMKRTKTTTMVLVEGPRDALRLLAEGVPAVAILGTNQFTKTKALTLISGGVESVVLLMDGDCAGKKATALIEPILRKYVEVHVLRLWLSEGSPWLKYQHEVNPTKAAKAAGEDLYDPGNMPDGFVDRLISKFFPEFE